ncbi:UNVERIFIED_CONTAM: putative receptor-like protein kinase [Sesamum angustifolium]|uniref:Receptor-like protein kinase n=1 Tax=Sesamum angustifolium TaxID=2727405 RepID=A0AAW2QNU0_9LAMI
MSNENLILKIRLLLLAWFHLRSQPGPPSLLKRFSYKDIKKATDGFKRVIQNSSLGASYKAKFQNGHLATVKEVRLSDEDDDSFYREVQLLGRLHHRHIVALCGFSSGSKRFLVFENMEEGSLKEHLSDPLKTPLNWRTRLQIAIGIAAAVNAQSRDAKHDLPTRLGDFGADHWSIIRKGWCGFSPMGSRISFSKIHTQDDRS